MAVHRNFSDVVRFLWAWRNTFIAVVSPLALLPLVFDFDNSAAKDEMRCVYVLLLMIIYSVLKPVHPTATSLLPMLLFPLLQIVSAPALARRYLSENGMLFIGVAVLMVAANQVQLPKRFALNLLNRFGTEPRWLLAGFMLTSWFLSMWLIDPLVTSMLISIVANMVNAIRKAARTSGTHFDRGHGGFPGLFREQSLRDAPTDVIEYLLDEQSNVVPRQKRVLIAHFEQMIQIGTLYSSAIGRAAVLIGTETNLLAKHLMESHFRCPSETIQLNFLSWTIYALPVSITMLVFLWFWLLLVKMGPVYTFCCYRCANSPTQLFNSFDQKTINTALKTMQQELPPFSLKDFIVLLHCATAVGLLFTRVMYWDPLIGWDAMAPGFISDNTAVILLACLILIFPSSGPQEIRNARTYAIPEPAVNWESLLCSFPLGSVLVIGGATAGAYGAHVSGLTKEIAESFFNATSNLSDKWLLIGVLVTITLMATFIPNDICVMLSIPVLNLLGKARQLSPLFFSLPASLQASLTLPLFHAIYGHGFSGPRLVVGLALNVVSVPLLYLAATTWGSAYLQIGNKIMISSSTPLPVAVTNATSLLILSNSTAATCAVFL